MKKIPLNTVGILKDYELNTYLDDKLAPQTRYCTRLSRDAIMKWQSYEISSPLTKILNDSYHEIATSIFNRKLNLFFISKFKTEKVLIFSYSLIFTYINYLSRSIDVY